MQDNFRFRFNCHQYDFGYGAIHSSREMNIFRCTFHWPTPTHTASNPTLSLEFTYCMDAFFCLLQWIAFSYFVVLNILIYSVSIIINSSRSMNNNNNARSRSRLRTYKSSQEKNGSEHGCCCCNKSDLLYTVLRFCHPCYLY